MGGEMFFCVCLENLCFFCCDCMWIVNWLGSVKGELCSFSAFTGPCRLFWAILTFSCFHPTIFPILPRSNWGFPASFIFCWVSCMMNASGPPPWASAPASMRIPRWCASLVDWSAWTPGPLRRPDGWIEARRRSRPFCCCIWISPSQAMGVDGGNTF